MRTNAIGLVLVLSIAHGAGASAQDAVAPDSGVPSGPRVPAWVEGDPFSSGADDPLGVDRGDRLERVAPVRPEDEVQRRVPVSEGEVLTAIAGVREASHEVEVRLQHGLAVVDAELRFESRARYAAEVRYRLAVPEGASLARLEVCDVHGCREGLVDDATGPLGPYDDAIRSPASGDAPPIAHAAPIRDARGEAIWLRAAPVRPAAPAVRGRSADEETLTVRVRYLVAAPIRGARARLVIPARGRDDRIASARVRVRSDELSHGAVDGVDAVERAVDRVPWEPFEVVGRLDRGGAAVTRESWTVPCGEGRGRCARVRVVAAPRPTPPRELIVLLDVSPSTAGPARGRLAPAFAALLGSLPSASRVQVVAFAAHATPIVEAPTAPTAISLVDVSRALERPLGSATRFEAAWERIEPWVRAAQDPRIVILGDGGLTTGSAREALRAARRAGARIASINVADRASTPGLTAALAEVDGTVVDVGPEADRAGRGHGMEALEERIAPLFAPVVEPRARARVGRRTIELGELRAGEERVWEGVVEGGRSTGTPEPIAMALRDRLERAAGLRARPLRLAALSPEALAASPRACTVSGSFGSASAVIPRGVRLIAADTRRCDRPSVPEPGSDLVQAQTEAIAARAPSRLQPQTAPSTLPRRALRTLLRQRLVPVARGCFRDDRAGRANYQRRAIYRFTLADREVTDADVTGEIAPALRACLITAVDDLEVPPFDGSITVSYPLYTEPHLPPPTLSLDAEVADVVDAVAAPGE